MAIYGVSMQPVYHAGDLIWTEEIQPEDVKVGDIIAFRVPAAVREAYNYPATVAHRVVKINSDHGITYRTKGDNSGEDPFTVRPQDLLGKVNQHIPYMGFPLLFLQSQQGLIFSIIALILLALYLYASELNQGVTNLHRGIFAPVVNENERISRTFEQKFESTEESLQQTRQTLSDFTSAIAEYAKHLQSHTSAIQSLAEASQELKKSAAQQNEALASLLRNSENVKSYKQLEDLPSTQAVSTAMKTPYMATRTDKSEKVDKSYSVIKSELEPAKSSFEPLLAKPEATNSLAPEPARSNSETPLQQKSNMQDLSDLFAEATFEARETHKLAKEMDDVPVTTLLEDGLQLASELRKLKQ